MSCSAAVVGGHRRHLHPLCQVPVPGRAIVYSMRPSRVGLADEEEDRRGCPSIHRRRSRRWWARRFTRSAGVAAPADHPGAHRRAPPDAARTAQRTAAARPELSRGPAHRRQAHHRARRRRPLVRLAARRLSRGARRSDPGALRHRGRGDGRRVPAAPRGRVRPAARRLMTRFDAWALGYPDELCVRPGQTVRFHVSGAGADTVDAQLVKLIHGDTQPGGPGFREVEVPSAVDGTYPLRDQPTPPRLLRAHPGRRRRSLPVARRAGSASSRWSSPMPTPASSRCSRPGTRPPRPGWRSCSSPGCAPRSGPAARASRCPSHCWPASGTPSADRGTRPGAPWSSVPLPVVNSYNSRFGPVTQVAPQSAEVVAAEAPAVPDVDLLLGALDAADARIVRGAYNGKLALPCVYAGPLGDGQFAALAGSGARPAVADRLRAWWDLSRDIDTSVVASGRHRRARRPPDQPAHPGRHRPQLGRLLLRVAPRPRALRRCPPPRRRHRRRRLGAHLRAGGARGSGVGRVRAAAARGCLRGPHAVLRARRPGPGERGGARPAHGELHGLRQRASGHRGADGPGDRRAHAGAPADGPAAHGAPGAGALDV